MSNPVEDFLASHELNDSHELNEVWMCAMCLSSITPPINCCSECGSGGCAIPTTKSLMELVQKHDQQRLEALDKKEQELRALRLVMMQMYGPITLGMHVEKQGEDVLGVRYKNVVMGGTPLPNETLIQFLMRVGEAVALDPVEVRHLLHWSGVKEKSRVRTRANREISTEQVTACSEWIDQFATKTKTVRPSTSAYVLKHKVEEWLRESRHKDTYIPEEAFTQAAVNLGYEASSGKDYTCFNMSFKEEALRAKSERKAPECQ